MHCENIQGWDDFELTPTGYFYKNALPENPGSPFISANNIQILEFIDILNDRVDACPDIYSFNFCSYSGTCFFPRRIDNPGQLNTPQALVKNLQQYLHIENEGIISLSQMVMDSNFILVLKRLRKHIPLLQIVDIIDI